MIQWIKIYFRKRKLIKMLQQLSSEMILLSNSEPNFIHHQEKLMLQRYLISDEQIATFLNPHVHAFYSKESPYKINSVLETYFETAKIEFATFPMYIQLLGIFQNQKLRYWTSYANFEKAIQKQNQLIEAHTQKAEMFLLEIDKIRQDYFTHSILARLVNHYKDTYQFFRSGEQNGISSCIKQGYIYYDNLKQHRTLWNDEYVKRELTECDELLSTIDGKSLDLQQRKAVVIDEDSNLVLAGAGSGKTLTIAAKVKYLVERKQINPEDILLISFTAKSALEMEERVKDKLGLPVTAKTFHALGLEIIGKANQARPTVFQKNG